MRATARSTATSMSMSMGSRTSSGDGRATKREHVRVWGGVSPWWRVCVHVMCVPLVLTLSLSAVCYVWRLLYLSLLSVVSSHTCACRAPHVRAHGPRKKGTGTRRPRLPRLQDRYFFARVAISLHILLRGRPLITWSGRLCPPSPGLMPSFPTRRCHRVSSHSLRNRRARRSSARHQVSAKSQSSRRLATRPRRSWTGRWTLRPRR